MFSITHECDTVGVQKNKYRYISSYCQYFLLYRFPIQKYLMSVISIVQPRLALPSPPSLNP